MTWLTAVVALALMLAVLTLDPSQLQVVNGSTTSQVWQSLSYAALLIFIVLWCGLFLIQRFRPKTPSPIVLSSTKSSSATPVFLTPSYSLRQQGTVVLLLKGLCVLLLWFAASCQAIAQRIEMIEHAPHKTQYVEATVSPIGLSDRRLTFESLGNDSANTDSPQVDQAYRQLVQISDIQPYSSQKLSRESGATAEALNQRANPFNSNPHLAKDSPSTSTTNTSAANLPKQRSALPEQMTVMLQTYRADYAWLNQLSADKQVRLQLQLDPLEFNHNPDEFNEYRWLSSRHATATAKVVSGKADDNSGRLIDSRYLSNSHLSFRQWIDVRRFKLREHFLQLLAARRDKHSGHDAMDGRVLNDDVINEKAEAVAVTLSLLTGDRSLISTEMTGLYRFAGISHLLAISGAHVLFLAMLCASLSTAIINQLAPKLYRILPRWQCAFLVAVSAAFIYALFAGFDVPALRTACMLLVVGVLRYLLATPAIFKVLLALAVLMAWQDVFVLWQAGFWLSFIAVAVLVVYSQRWENSSQQSSVSLVESAPALNDWRAEDSSNLLSQIKRNVVALIKLQLWMSLALLPISLWLFGKVSLWGFIVNLFAIGLFGWVIVPLNLLAGVVYAFWPALADKIWSVLFWVLEQFHGLLLSLQHAAQQTGWLYTDIGLALLFLILLAALPWMLPKAMMSRWLAVPAMVLITCLSVSNAANKADSVRISALDTPSAFHSATLIEFGAEKWLLLSAYPNKYAAKRAVNNPAEKQQMHALGQTVYEQLKRHKVKKLTGVVVQTSTAELSHTVAKIRELMPISYYWHTGLAIDAAEVKRNIQGQRLTAQHCQAGKTWQSQVDAGESGESVQGLSAITGWSIGSDKSVSDCTLQIDTANQILLANAEGGGDLIVAQRLNRIGQTNPLNHSMNQVILYSSAQPKLAKLWQHMCFEEDKPQVESPVGKDATVEMTIAANNVPEYWITTSQAWVSKPLVDIRKPASWHVLEAHKTPTHSSLTDAHLYWQQQHEQDVDDKADDKASVVTSN